MIVCIFFFIIHFSKVLAKDPPLFLQYKKRVIQGLVGGYDGIDSMYQRRFVDFTKAKNASINKSAVYYDSLKSLFEFKEMTYNRTGLSEEEVDYLDRIPEYMLKSKSLIAQRSKDVGGSGFQAFPHGLAYFYQNNGDTEAYEGLVGLRNIGNMFTGVNPARMQIRYSREVAYSLQIGITSQKLNIPYTTSMDTETIMSMYLDYALSQMDQWHTGEFIDLDRMYRSSFMTGLTMFALIEYYERIQPDNRIQPAIKKVIDDLWNTVWHPDLHFPTPESLGDASRYYEAKEPNGAFWTWADWDKSKKKYVIDRNHNPSSPDVGHTHNMLICGVYAWYATISGDESYMDKAVDIFKGAALNLSTYTPEGQLFEGIRYTIDFLRYYRSFYNTPCSLDAIRQCKNPTDCQNIGGNWSGERCQHDMITIQTQ